MTVLGTKLEPTCALKLVEKLLLAPNTALSGTNRFPVVEIDVPVTLLGINSTVLNGFKFIPPTVLCIVFPPIVILLLVTSCESTKLVLVPSVTVKLLAVTLVALNVISPVSDSINKKSPTLKSPL